MKQVTLYVERFESADYPAGAIRYDFTEEGLDDLEFHVMTEFLTLRRHTRPDDEYAGHVIRAFQELCSRLGIQLEERYEPFPDRHFPERLDRLDWMDMRYGAPQF